MVGKQTEIAAKKKIAFVCSGGAVKAACFHLGVALALEESGFSFMGGCKDKNSKTTLPENPLSIQTYVGSSAGSVVAALLASGHNLKSIFHSFIRRGDQPERVLKRFSYHNLLSLNRPKEVLKIKTMKSLIKNPLSLGFKGLFSTQGIEKYMREHVLPSNDFNDLLPDLFSVTTQLNHSRKVVFSRYKYPTPVDDPSIIYSDDVNISQSVAASAALPPIYTPYGIKNKQGKLIYYFDGEIKDTLSTHIAKDNGCDLIIASYTHQPYRYSPEIGSLTQYGMSSIMIQAIYLILEKKIHSAIYRRNQSFAVLDAVNQFCKENFLDEALRKKLLDLLSHKLDIKKELDYIYIHPSSDDYQIFFGNHFNLMPKKMGAIVKTGYHRGMETLKNYQFSH